MKVFVELCCPPRNNGCGEAAPANAAQDTRRATIRFESAFSWAKLVERVACATKVEPKQLEKGYLWQWCDDEDEWIVISSDADCAEAWRVQESAGRLNIMIQPCSEALDSSCCHSDTTCGSSSSTIPSSSCCPPSQQQAIPAMFLASRDPRLKEHLELQTSPAPPKITNPDASKYQYQGEALRAVACPLGGCGAGCIALAGDGGLRQWQVLNRICHDAHVPCSFFGLKTETSSQLQHGLISGGNDPTPVSAPGATGRCTVLQSSENYDQSGFTPAPIVTDHVVPDASKKLLEELPGVPHLRITGKYPTMEMEYLDPESPVTVTMEALSPCIPLDSKRSGLPAIFFIFNVQNSSAADVDVSLLMSQQNFVGWDGSSQITNDVFNAGFGANVNAKMTMNGVTAIDMTKTDLDAKDPRNGHVMTAVFTQDGDDISTMLQYSSPKDLWAEFEKGKLPGQGAEGPSVDGKTWNSALSCKRTVAANSSTSVVFALVWHFPNRFVNWSQKGFYIDDTQSDFWLGNQYANFWPTATDVLEFCRDNLDSLISDTRMFRDAMFTSNLPWQLIDSAAGRASVPRSPSCMWLGDGTFYNFEGCSPDGGCCPLNCTHVLDYSMTLSRLWPDLEQTVRANDLDLQLSPNGILPSRSTVPIWLRRQWSFWPDCTQRDPDQTICSDGEICTVLKTYREVLFGASQDWFNDKYPYVKKIITRWLNVMDDQGDGVVRGAQPSTYDVAFFGANTFIGTLYMASLKAMEQMATLQGDGPTADACSKRYQQAASNYDTMCYGTKPWYTQVVDPAHPDNVVSDSTFVDSLLGQWWAYILNLGDLLPNDHMVSTVQNIMKYNHVDSFDPARQAPRKFCDQRDAGCYVATWGGPENPPPKNALLYTSEACWSGLVYSFAGLAFQLGQDDVGMQMLTDVRNQYDGTRRSPWNEIECGDHYTRAMSSFALFEIASGQFYDAPHGILSFAPRLSPQDFCGFFISGTAWGQYSQKGPAGMTSGTATLSVNYGTAQFTIFRVASKAKTASVTLGSKTLKPIITSITEFGVQFLRFDFGSAQQVPAGQKLQLTFSS